MLCADADAAAADLASGKLTCPSCGTGRLRAWGYGQGALRVTAFAPRGCFLDSVRRTIGGGSVRSASESSGRKFSALSRVAQVAGGGPGRHRKTSVPSLPKLA